MTLLCVVKEWFRWRFYVENAQTSIPMDFPDFIKSRRHVDDARR